MLILPQLVAHSKHLQGCLSHEAARRRLAALAYCATHVQPTVNGWAVLHTAWREIEPTCEQSPELATEHARVDALLGGFGPSGRSSGSDTQNVKGDSPVANSGCLEFAEGLRRQPKPLTGRRQAKYPTLLGRGGSLPDPTTAPAASDAVAVAAFDRWAEK